MRMCVQGRVVSFHRTIPVDPAVSSILSPSMDRHGSVRTTCSGTDLERTIPDTVLSIGQARNILKLVSVSFGAVGGGASALTLLVRVFRSIER
ncbi:MAG: hypothetical protein IPJ07_26960 [Acidobacteria bacterium]|nr:hypothetical protein [Acidobacteriota bacterium]